MLTSTCVFVLTGLALLGKVFLSVLVGLVGLVLAFHLVGATIALVVAPCVWLYDSMRISRPVTPDLRVVAS